MWVHFPDVNTVNEPIELSATQLNRCIGQVFWPREFALFKNLHPHRKACFMPIQTAQRTIRPIGKNIQTSVKWILTKFSSNHLRQRKHSSSKVDRLLAKIDFEEVATRSHDSSLRSPATHPPETDDGISSLTPEASTSTIASDEEILVSDNGSLRASTNKLEGLSSGVPGLF